MSGKSDFLDYEPLKKIGSKSLGTEEPGIRRSVSKATDSEEPGVFNKSGKNDLAEAVLPDQPQSKETPVPATLVKAELKSGHGASFIGLFLFTVLVFVRPYELWPSLMWLSKGALVTALVTLVVFIPTQLGLENQITVRVREVNLALLLLLLAFISVPFATDKELAWGNFVDYSKVIVMFVVMVNVIRTEGRLKALLLLILVVSVALSIAAINDYLKGNLDVMGERERISGLIGGLFQNPNDLALHLVTFFPIVIALALASRNPGSKLIYFGSSILLLAGIVSTLSRGAFLGVIAVFAALVFGLGIKNKALVGVFTVILVVGFLVMAPSAYRSRLRTTGDDSATSRTNELKRSLFLTIRHPIFGLGIGNYVVYSDTQHATHNAYTQVSAEVGVPAGIVYVLFLIGAFKRVRRLPRPKEVDSRNKLLPYLAIGLQAALVGYMVTSFFASVAFLWYVYYLVGYAICVSRLLGSSVDGKQSPADPQRVPMLPLEQRVS